MKVDKELLVKHHFWVLLAAYTPLVFLSLVLLWTSVASAIDAKAKKINDLKTKVGGIKSPKNPAWIDAITEKADRLAKQKNKTWDQVWGGQAAVFTWPEEVRKAYPEVTEFDYGDDLKNADLRERYIKRNSYKKEYEELKDIVQPVDDKGEGVVQFRGGDWRNILRHVSEWMGGGVQSIPTSQDIWLAQEDYWVQRELMQVIRDANDGLAVYNPSKETPKRAAGVIDHRIFENPRWKLEIILEQKQLRWRITNRSSRQQTLGFTCKVKLLGTNQQYSLWIDGEPLAPNQTSNMKPDKNFKGFLTLKGIDGVEQMLDWRTAPIKRIDKVELPYHAHSTIGQQLLPFAGFVTEAEKDKEAAGGTGAPGAPAMKMDRPPMVAPGGPGGAAGARAGNALGLDKNRYVDVSPQVRRMPVGVALIVDQAHTQDVLAAFARSRLRFQITQVEWRRYRGEIKPAGVDVPAADVGKPPKTGVAPMPRPVGPMGPMGPGVKPRPGPGMPQEAGDDEDSSNLVELVVYGITSLYHKYPPKAPAGEAAADAKK
jgi:hypothetical protein